MKKKLFLNNVDESTMNQSVSCEFGPDGVRFIRAGIKVTKDGMSRINGSQIMPLSIVKEEDIEFGAYIGRGATGVVQEGIYKPNMFPIAIKTINVYDKHKRHQVMNDLKVYLSDIFSKGTTNVDEEMMRYLVQLYGAYFDEGSIKIILELMDVGSLRDILDMTRELKTGPPYIEEPFLANIAYQMLNGLNYLHGKKHQIHRDIKPENVLMNSLGQVKLTDFGISKELEKTIDVCKTFVGTMTYMSPERVEGKSYTYSSDIWSFGLMLIELVSGEFPFGRGKTFIEMLQTILMSNEPTLPNNGLYSEELIDFIRLCLNKDPSKRSTAYELLQHKWLYINSELKKDLSEWITNILFTCKYEKMNDEEIKTTGYHNQKNGASKENGTKAENELNNGQLHENGNKNSQTDIEITKGNHNYEKGTSMNNGNWPLTDVNVNGNFEVPKPKYQQKQLIKCDMDIEILD